MRNIRLTIEYDGLGYCGWQTQKKIKGQPRKKISAQEAIESCLKKILKHEVKLIASGRTDSGVHALGQVANFRTSSKITPDKIRLALNYNLPKKIRIVAAQYIPLKFHSRYDPVSKIYRYYILNQDYKPPFLENYCYWVKLPLNVKLMQRAAGYLLGKHDFKVFCASGSKIEDTRRTVKRAVINKLSIFSCNLICVEIEADGFLYNMARNIVGTLIEIGRERFAPQYIKKIIAAKDRSLAGPCVPARGLFLVEVKY
ncbi:MAG: tRNA pseudouridine(38-40) synthase TruA [Candidatus Omnitrophica bacterium]|nr:tRNA pseudouridine(38-40) synthase TruA [Candidatus Omnitrophota bacterium]MDD5355728.1 tRNA pseudouridine(38-40) synthase TruA [Candidatus Omnitrophota bacterium]